MQHLLKTLAATSILILGSCGGGGSSVPVTVLPPPPTPSPPPPPPPPPPPLTSTARVYATSKATGLIEFTTGDIDIYGELLTLGFTARDGRYYPGYANAIAQYTGIGTAPGVSATGDYALAFKRTQVFDHETGVFVGMFAPANMRMVTPLTSMLVAPGSTEAKLETQIGITNSLFQMVVNPDLGTYDAVTESESGDTNRVADAARMHSANLRVLAIMGALTKLGAGTYYAVEYTGYGDLRPAITPTEALGARCLAAAPALFIFQNDRMSSVIQCYLNGAGASQSTPTPYLQLSNLKIQAIAHLVNGYAAAIPLRLETSAEKARWLLGIAGYLKPMVAKVTSDLSDGTAQAILGITATTPTIIAETSRYSEALRYNETGRFMASPDFIVLSNVTSLQIQSSDLIGNDILLSNEKFNTRGFDREGISIQAITVPAVNSSQLSVTESPSGRYTVTALNGYKGVSYFDYLVSAPNGEQRTTRVYVRVM